MKIETYALPGEAGELKGKNAVVLDVLRATTNIVLALNNGAKGVIPVAEVEEAYEYRQRDAEVILGGERNRVLIPGFDLANSPSEYTAAAVAGNGGFISSKQMPPEREIFFQGLPCASDLLSYMNGYVVRRPLPLRIYRGVRSFLSQIKRRIFG